MKTEGVKSEVVNNITILVEQKDCLYYPVFVCGTELPVAMFSTAKLAEWFCEHSDMSLDKEIRTVDFWAAAGPLFRDRTQPFKFFSKTQGLFKPLEN